MKVVFLAGASQMGGAERSLLDMVAELSASSSRWQVSVVLPGHGPLETALRELAVSTTVIPQPPELSRLGDASLRPSEAGYLKRLGGFLAASAPALLSAVQYLSQLRAELQKQAPDIVHTNGAKLHLAASRTAPSGAAIVWHIRDFVSSRTVMKRLLRTVSRRCSAAIANSHAVAADVRRSLPTVPVHTVYNGIDMDQFRPDGPKLDLDAAAGWEPQPPGIVRVGLVATFARWKGHEIFIRALAALPPGLAMRAYIVGGPLYTTEGSQYALDELRALGARYGLAPGRLGFTGHVEEPAKALRALDIVVHASTSPEPFGRVIVEAMATGRAVLVAAAGGAAELVSGLPLAAYPSGDWEALARRLEQLISDDSTRTLLAEAGHAVARARFDRRRLPQELTPIYESVLKRSAHVTR